MDSSSLAFLSFLFSVLVLSHLNTVASELVLEDEYTVTTLINGHELKINPYSVIAKPGAPDLVVLDSSCSSFYTLSFPFSQGGGVERLAGDGAGYSDGELGSARFNKPRSFAFDLKGNIYVADKTNHAIRKISNSGGVVRVSTIAGGDSHKVGYQDGPAQNATFSSDFELAFVPEMCALLISDHGNQLVRRIDLKQEDCARESQPPALNAVPFWLLGLGLSCVIGMVIGIGIRSYVIPNEGFRPPYISTTWKHWLMNPVKPVPLMHCFDIRSAVANSRLCALLRRVLQLALSYLSLMLRVNPVVSQSPKKAFVSLLDCDVNSAKVEKSQMYADQLKDLIDYDGDLKSSNTEKEVVKQGEWEATSCDGSRGGQPTIDNMILANIAGFTLATRETTQQNVCLVGNSGLVRMRASGQD